VVDELLQKALALLHVIVSLRAALRGLEQVLPFVELLLLLLLDFFLQSMMRGILNSSVGADMIHARRAHCFAADRYSTRLSSHFGHSHARGAFT